MRLVIRTSDNNVAFMYFTCYSNLSTTINRQQLGSFLSAYVWPEVLSHSDSSHTHACNWSTFYTCTGSGSPYNVMHSPSTINSSRLFPESMCGGTRLINWNSELNCSSEPFQNRTCELLLELWAPKLRYCVLHTYYTRRPLRRFGGGRRRAGGK